MISKYAILELYGFVFIYDINARDNYQLGAVTHFVNGEDNLIELGIDNEKLRKEILNAAIGKSVEIEKGVTVTRIF